MILYVAIGGAIGASARYLVNLAVPQIFGEGFPWATLIANVLGCLLMGLTVSLMAARFADSPELKLFLTTGILGGFTTFSAFSLDFFNLVQRGETLPAFAYATGSVILSLAAVFLGMAMTRQIIQ